MYLKNDDVISRELAREMTVVPMYLPPLRDYAGSIPSMIKQFVQDADIAYGRSVVGFSEDAYDSLRKHLFPGNVRELRNIVEQGVLMAEGAHVELSDLPPYLRGEVAAPPMPGSLAPVGGAAASPGHAPRSRGPVVRTPPTLDAVDIQLDGADWAWKELKDQVLRRFEERYLAALLRTTDGNVSRAAELAGIHRVNLHKMIKRHDPGES